MTCRGFIQILLKVINALFVLAGLAMIGYGIYMFITYDSSSSSTSPPPPPPSLSPPSSPSSNNFLMLRSLPAGDKETGFTHGSIGLLNLRRSLLSKPLRSEHVLSSSFWSTVSTVWFLIVFIAVGVVIILITCSGYIAAATENGCCLSCYSVFVALVILIELGLASFIFFDDSWDDVIPDDSTGELASIENFIDNNLKILRWVALGIVAVQALALLMAVILRALASSAKREYDSDDDYLAPRTSRQPLINRQTTAGAGTAGTGSDGRPARSDAWSTRMREKYGLDTNEFSYNPAEKRAGQQPTAAGEEKKSRCSIM